VIYKLLYVYHEMNTSGFDGSMVDSTSCRVSNRFTGIGIAVTSTVTGSVSSSPLAFKVLGRGSTSSASTVGSGIGVTVAFGFEFTTPVTNMTVSEAGSTEPSNTLGTITSGVFVGDTIGVAGTGPTLGSGSGIVMTTLLEVSEFDDELFDELFEEVSDDELELFGRVVRRGV